LGAVARKVARQVATGNERALADKVISSEEVRELLGRPKVHPERAAAHDEVGISTGMYYTPMGGDIMFVEASIRRGAPARVVPSEEGTTVRVGPITLILTGQLGDVMKESARAALTYATNNTDALGIPAARAADASEAHIHVPAGAIPKDGPSAGIAIATALVSEMAHRPVRRDVAMTGEITLRGRVLPIGGVKEKVLGAHRAGITEVILPKANEADLEDVPADVRETMRFHPVETMRDVLAIALAPNGVEHTVAAPVGGAGEPAAAGDGRVPVGARG
jgi:ATP-dependent Lon protease